MFLIIWKRWRGSRPWLPQPPHPLRSGGTGRRIGSQGTQAHGGGNPSEEDAPAASASGETGAAGRRNSSGWKRKRRKLLLNWSVRKWRLIRKPSWSLPPVFSRRTGSWKPVLHNGLIFRKRLKRRKPAFKKRRKETFPEAERISQQKTGLFPGTALFGQRKKSELQRFSGYTRRRRSRAAMPSRLREAVAGSGTVSP